LPVDALQPLETRLVNVSAFVESGLIPKGVTHLALEANHQGVAGDLGINVFSVGQDQNFVFRAEGSPVYSHIVYSSYWDIANDLMGLLAVQNAGDEGVQAEATLYWQTPHGTGSYTLPQIELPGNGSRIVNLKQRIQSGAPDKNGNVIPPGTTFGTLTLATVGNNTKSTIFGGSTSFDPLRGGYGSKIGGDPPCCPDDPTCSGFPFVPILQGGDGETCGTGTGGDPTPTRVINSITPARGLIGNSVPVTNQRFWTWHIWLAGGSLWRSDHFYGKWRHYHHH
jgi:hypothetical protein